MAVNPNIVRIAAEANRATPIMTSEQALQQQEYLEPSSTNIQPIQTSLEVYNRLQGKVLTPEQKEYYFNNTKDIIQPLNLNMPDDEIYSYLNNNDLRSLDSRIVSAYNEQNMLEPMDILHEVFGNVEDTVEQRSQKMKELYSKWVEQKPLTLEQIANLRSDITAQTAVEHEPKQDKSLLAREVKRANRAAQSLSKYQQQRNEQSGFSTVGDVAEQMGVGATFFRTILTNERLMQAPGMRQAMNGLLADAEKSYYKEGLTFENVAEFVAGAVVEEYYSVFRGSNLQRLSKAVNQLSDEDYNYFWDLIDNDPFLNTNLTFKGELISGIIGTSDFTAYATNILELANTIGTPEQIASGGKAFNKAERAKWKTEKALKKSLKQEKKAMKEALKKKEVVKDLDYSDIPVEPASVPTAQELSKTLQVQEIATPKDRYRLLLQTKQTQDGTWLQGYKYLDTTEDVIAEMKKNNLAVFEVVPSTDKRESGVVYWLDMYAESSKKHDGLYQEFSLNGNWDVFKERLRASAQAYANGSNVQGDLQAGATQRAASKLTSKLENGEPLNPSEQFAMLPEVSAGAKRNSMAIKKIPEQVSKDKEESDLVLEMMTGHRATPKDIDPEAFQTMEKAIHHDFELQRAALVNEGVELKFAKITTT